MTTLKVLNPVGAQHVDEAGPRKASPLGELEVIGIVDNTKPNAIGMMRTTAERLAEVVPDLVIRVERKTSASEGVSDTAFGKLEQEASVVLVGSAD